MPLINESKNTHSLEIPDEEFERVKYQFILAAFIIFVVLNRLEEFIYGKPPEISIEPFKEHTIEGKTDEKYEDVQKVLESYFTSGTDVFS